MPELPFPVRFPNQVVKEVVLIRLPDGRLVVRTREELETTKPPEGGAKG